MTRDTDEIRDITSDKLLDSNNNLEAPNHGSDFNLWFWGVVIEGGMVVLALVLANFGCYDHSQLLIEIDRTDGWRAIWLGGVGTLPMLLLLVVMHYWRPRFADEFHRFVDDKMVPLFRNRSYFEYGVLALLAGFGEELFFRWCLQGGISHLFPGSLGLAAGVLIASFVFALCHWVNWVYGILTLLIGFYLGGLMIGTGSFLVPAVTHALYDFIALIYLGRWLPKWKSTAAAESK